MTVSAAITLAILIGTFILLIKTKIPPPVVFIGALTAALTFQLAPQEELLKGFRNSGMLTVGILFVVAAGMYSTGAITMIMDKIIGRPRNLLTAQIKILPPIAFGSAFLNNTPLVAMMIPVIQDLARTCRLPAKHLYIPLSFASIMGGTCTLIGTSTNLVIGGLVKDAVNHGGESLPPIRPIEMFDTTLVALPITIVGIALLLVVGRWLLPKITEPKDKDEVRWRSYRAEFDIHDASRLKGKTLDESGLLGTPGAELLSVSREGVRHHDFASLGPLEAGDVLAFSVTREALLELWRTNRLLPHVRPYNMGTKRHTHQLTKVVISKQNRAVGRKVAELPLDTDYYQYKIVAVSRDRLPVRCPLHDLTIEAGDTVVLEVNDSFFFDVRTEEDFALTTAIDGFHVQRTDRALEATAITVIMVAVVAMGWMSMLNAGLLASGAMLLFGCIDYKKAARSIDWGTLIVIACAIGLESAVTRSGLADILSGLLTSIAGGNPYSAMVVIFLGCTFMTNVITNNAAAAFMFPIALATAAQLQVSFMPFAITLMIANSCAFITPTGYQTNLMVWGPGGYSFGDFVKIGIPMTLLVGAMTIFLTPMIFSF